MDSATHSPDRAKLIAYAAPMLVFVGLIALVSLVKSESGPLWRTAPSLWVFPLQTLVCAILLGSYWRHYEFHGARRIFWAIAIGIFVFVLWISPQAFFGFSARRDGFNPELVAAQPALYWGSVALRFVRLVIVVPLVEEIFWRGFLLRYFIDEKFSRVPFGSFSWLSFGVVCTGFMLVHERPDWPAALVTGALYNLVAYKTRSLFCCVVAHALTNLLLGLWIMQTKQWGFW